MKSFLPLGIGLMISFVSFSQHKFTTQKCKNASNDRTRKMCVIKEIQNYVDANYDVKSITSYAKSGTNKVYAKFTVDPAGKLTDIQAKSTAFELELAAIEVLRSYQGLIPAEMSKNEVATSGNETYTLPIVFEVQKTRMTLTVENKRVTVN